MGTRPYRTMPRQHRVHSRPFRTCPWERPHATRDGKRALFAEVMTHPDHRIPRTLEEVETLSWTEMQEVAAVLREREAVDVRQHLAALGEDQRRWLSEALSGISS
jgi:hypothetical protein